MSGSARSSDRDRILEAIDLVALIGEHVALKPKGREHVGLCPFHDDRAPSLAVVTHKGGAFYKCFACGAAGNAIDFMMEFHKLGFAEALKHLAARAGIALTERTSPSAARGAAGGIGKEDLLRANRLALRFYRRMLADEEGAPARAVLARRGMTAGSIEAFGIGYAPDRRDALETALARLRDHQRTTPDAEPLPTSATLVEAGLVRDGSGRGRTDLLRHRIVFPICDELGRPIAFGGRRIREEDEPKYLNSPETPLFHKSRSLFGIHLAKQAIIKSRVAVVTEGYTDVIACHAAGCTNVVATLGTALTREHARMLRRLCDRVILLFDGDAAGIRAAERGVEVFFAEPIDVQVCSLPDGRDPDELLALPDGPDLFRAALERSVDALAFLVERFRLDYLARHGLSGRQQALEALFSRLAELGFGHLDGVRKRFILAALADLTRLPDRVLEAGLAKAVAIVRARPRRAAGGADGGDVRTTEPSAADRVEPVSRARREAERHLLAALVAYPECATTTVTIDLGSGAGREEHRDNGRTVLSLTDAVGDGFFLDPIHRTVYQAWRHLIDSGDLPGPATLLAELAESRAKGLASELFAFGQLLASAPADGWVGGSVDASTDSSADGSAGNGRVGEDAQNHANTRRAVEVLVQAFADLERLVRRERDRADEASGPDARAAREPSSDGAALDVSTALERLARRRERGADPTVIHRPGPLPIDSSRAPPLSALNPSVNP